MLQQKNSLEAFFCRYPLLTYDPGERFKRPNEQGQIVRYIKSGYIKIHHYASSGKDISLYLAGPRQYKDLVFNYTSSFDKYYMSAISEVTLWSAPKKDFDTFLNMHPETMLLLVNGLYDAITAISHQTEWLKVSNSRIRIAGFLIGLAKNLAHIENTNEYVMDFPLTHQTIADHTGLTRETVSLQLIKFKNEGIIDYPNGYIRVLNLSALQTIVKHIL